MSNPNTKPGHFYLIFPNIFGFKGGIQVYSLFLLQALQQLYPHARYDVFLKYDKMPDLNLKFLKQTRFHCFGNFPHFLQSLGLALQVIILGIWQRPSLILTTHINYSLPCYVLQRLSHIPYWIIAHGDEVWNLKHRLRQIALSHANQVISVSRYTRDRLIQEQSLPPTQLSILPNTFKAKQFQIKPKRLDLLNRYGLTPTQPIILTVSRLGRTAAPYKGYDKIIKALVQVRCQIPDVHYLLVGKGDARSEIESLVEKLNLIDCVTLTGFVAEEQLCDYYNLCDVFALPSSIEGFGIVYLEALGCGKPVLAGNRDGACDPLQDGMLGCLVDPEDPDEIAQNLIQIIQGSYPNSRVYKPEILRQKTVDKFEWSQFVKNLAQLIEV